MGIYYIAVYVFILLVRTIRWKTSGEQDKRKIFFISLEVIYASLGIVVMVITTYMDTYITSILMLLLVMSIIASVYVDMADESKLSIVKKFIIHCCLIFMAAGAMVSYTFSTGQFFPESLTTKSKQHISDYIIYIPYRDISDKTTYSGSTFFLKSYTIKGQEKEKAVEMAIVEFENDKTVSPTRTRDKRIYINSDRNETVIYDSRNIIVKEIKNNHNKS